MLKYQVLIAAVLVFGCIRSADGQYNHDSYDAPYMGITAGSNVSINQVRAWLRSDNPHLVAWGAYFASRNNDDDAVEIMVELVEKWTPDRFSSDDHLAMSEILYALIKRNKPTPPEALSAVASTFPIQAVILASRLPIEDVTLLLENWYLAGKDVDLSKWNNDAIRQSFLARVAAMMLLKSPPPGFITSLRAELKQREHPSDLSKNQWFGHTQNQGTAKEGKCEDGVAPSQSQEWPPLFQYTLEENSPSSQDAPILVEEGDGDRITWRRAPAGVHLSGCYSPQVLNDDNLRRLVVEIPDEYNQQTSATPQTAH
jgi:hypothetical protein